MKIVKTIEELKEIRKELNGTIGFVPTMGALHDGHISLIKEARANNDFVIVSIFVNPTQFLPNEDLSSYPRKAEADAKICQMCKVDFLFMPEVSTMYEKSEVLIKAPQNSYVLEGFTRPGHFDGVLQVVLKLFNLTSPTNAYFGKKDAQQLTLIQQMVKNLFLNINIVPCPIIRENSGLALSSRNVYLDANQKIEALKISKSIYMAGNLIAKGERNSLIVINKIYEVLENLDVEYVKVVDNNFNEIKEIEPKNTIILVVVRFGKIRLLDNIWM
ncbi:pantoate--beta-alanine ligase [Aliarcobacter thereius]|uniref:Pantothenate synthetase n=2 Tax=Aliarcobacter thereius TaxID=544718 RepID=A0A1C0B9I3_9BACT|nr:pantoate--beta-alanine ligase [Aliarcobacter thereius]OCL94812.1 Pantothenate synthetase [Aliarcobacter thereius LMG 24486]OCM00259.1 Pantothenate synthetase [Aliarcobacter thereius]QBF15313.1 pantothenate synthetase [Aliarcobacter thereius LMG 24486]TLS72465.1 pantoate--beta-alanine ligase [Aliarcobacter thereius]TLS92051.1 pantoate--beta-alanine ligase [Aliarcobacter thereius]